MDSTTNIVKYLGIFGAIYLCTLIVMAVISAFFDGISSTGVGLVMLYLSGQLTAIRFVKNERRLPEKTEKRKLVWGSVLLSFALSILLAGVVILSEAGQEGFKELVVLGERPLFVWTIIILVVVLIHWGLLSLAYGRGVKKYATSQNLIGDTFD